MSELNKVIRRNFKNTFFLCEVHEDKFCTENVLNHMLVFVQSGKMELQTEKRNIHLQTGEAVFIKKNINVGEVKQPSKDGTPFRGYFIHFTSKFLHKVISEIPVELSNSEKNSASIPDQLMLPKNKFLKELFDSVMLYFNEDSIISEQLLHNKLTEALLLLLQIEPDLASVLFDFKAPYRIDLEAFMESNFKKELTIEQFAHFSGRSLTPFKKEFFEIFHETPSRWIVRRRLHEAKKLILENIKPADIYLNVGFKNLTHFHTAFKKEFGVSPSNFEQ